MEFIDLIKQYQFMKPDMDAAIIGVLDEGQYILGPQVQELEQVLARYVGVKHCVTVSSKTDALMLGLKCCGIGAGDGVVTSAFAHFSTAEAIALLGATPIFCDVGPDAYTMDAFCLEQCIKNWNSRMTGISIRAVVAVDIFGTPVDYDSIERICQIYGLELLEDGGQAMGSTYKEKKAGSFGRFGCTSFYPTQPLGSYGNGGAIFTDSDKDAELLFSLRNHGRGADPFDHRHVGISGRLDTIQAAVLLQKFKVFEQELEQRKKVADRYTRHLKGLVKVPATPLDTVPNRAVYTIGLKDEEERVRLKTYLDRRKIPTRILYPIPLHRQLAFENQPKQNLPNAEEAADRVLSLPISPWQDDKVTDKICEEIHAVLMANKDTDEA